MGSARVLAVAAAAAFMSIQAAQAADLPPLMAPMPAMQRPVVSDFSGWYLRGDVGVGSQSFSKFDFNQNNSAFVWPASWRIDQKDMGDASIFGVGIGYSWNSWLRFDATAEYRTSSKFKAVGSYTEFCPGGRCFDVYDGSHSATVVMANAYVDLGTWWCLTPFIGAGIGTAYNRVAGLTDTGYISNGTTGFGITSSDNSAWSLAWAAHAGVGYQVTKNLTLELAYRYLNMGSPKSSIIDCNSTGCQTNGPRASYSLSDFTSHDFKLGVRWQFSEPDMPAPPPPLVRKG
jgi:opacity protein-like surface antigen